jgi:hypothetical protein
MTTELTYNNLKSTTIRGIFNNSNSPDGTILADGTFDGDLRIKKCLYLGDFDANSGGNICLKVDGNEATITSKELLTAVNPQSLIIDQFTIFYDQFVIGSQYNWAFIE